MEGAMENTMLLRQRAEEHRTIARATHDLWESVIRFSLAARYEELAARRETETREQDAPRG
jgi:hypothetical protein